MKKLSIIIPCFNSAPNIEDLQITLERLAKKITDFNLEIILVDDGSKDNTYALLSNFTETTDLDVKIVKLTGNFGSYNAFLAGLHHGNGEVFAQVHPDMQDHPDHLLEMLEYYRKGIPYIIGQRVEREDNDSTQWFAKLYHKIVKKIALPDIPEGGYDLILFSKELRDHIVNMNESNINLVYLLSWLKYPYVTIPIKRESRRKGTSQWTTSKKIKLVADTIVGFSYTPIRCLTFISLCFVLLSIVYSLFTLLFSHFSYYQKTLIILVLALLNLISIGISILGEYLWRTLEAARKRPPFIVESLIETKSNH
jgi:dolichol-phosphate mannosyltransferase